jgi:Holliday junction resolvase
MVEDIASLARRLEGLVARLLEANGYRVLRTPASPDFGTDIAALSPDGEGTFAVEVKLYRSSKIETRVLRNAAAQIAHVKKETGSKGMLVATTTFDDRDRKLLRNIGIDEAWDISEIRKRASVDADLAADFEKLFRDAELRYASSATERESSLSSEVGSAQNGEQLALMLQGTTAGAADARRFETLCQECIQYLFGEHFGQFQAQNRVEQGFQIMDLIARLTPKDTGAFWL